MSITFDVFDQELSEAVPAYVDRLDAYLLALGPIGLQDAVISKRLQGANIRYELTLQYSRPGPAQFRAVCFQAQADADVDALAAAFFALNPTYRVHFCIDVSLERRRSLLRNSVMCIYADSVIPNCGSDRSRPVVVEALDSMAPGATGTVALVTADGTDVSQQFEVTNRSGITWDSGNRGYASAAMGTCEWDGYVTCCDSGVITTTTTTSTTTTTVTTTSTTSTSTTISTSSTTTEAPSLCCVTTWACTWDCDNSVWGSVAFIGSTADASCSGDSGWFRSGDEGCVYIRIISTVPSDCSEGVIPPDIPDFSPPEECCTPPLTDICYSVWQSVYDCNTQIWGTPTMVTAVCGDPSFWGAPALDTWYVNTVVPICRAAIIVTTPQTCADVGECPEPEQPADPVSEEVIGFSGCCQ